MRRLDALYLAISAALMSGACGSPRDEKEVSTPDASAEGGLPALTGSDAAVDAGQTLYSDAASDTDAMPLPTPRRPFLVGKSMRSATSVRRKDWIRASLEPDAALDHATARLLAKSWLKDALEEHASIAAFARFTLQLMSHGAPPDLLIAAQRAALDEVAHAQGCFALAVRYGGQIEGPGPVRVHDTLGGVTLSDLAFLAAQEGCVGETLGANLARTQLEHATDPFVRTLLTRIVRDEARHAELAWRFAGWAVREGGAPVLRAIETGIAEAVADTLAVPVRTYDGIDLEAFRAHGRITCETARSEARRAIELVVQPALADLQRFGLERAPSLVAQA